MAYVITEACLSKCDTACVDVCPVDAIHGPLPRLQLFIDPDACICCAACVPECPVNAIVEDVELPPNHPSIVRAADFFRRR